MNVRDVAKSRVLLVDDHPIVRKGLAQLLAQQGRFAICGEAGSLEEGLRAYETLQPSLVVADLTLGKEDGLELVRLLRAQHPVARILILSMHDEESHALPALQAGANGYVMKQDAVRHIVHAIDQVLAGETYLSERLRGNTFRPGPV